MKALNYSFVNPANAFTTNVLLMENLLELQRENKFKQHPVIFQLPKYTLHSSL